ncbi:hypothetical protein FA13DRAFT_225052 [Coprinellus micaceus]|uniref:Uncharacterized protein n=1 Tax=Coprinellus micaceus TaxID=71717 RepID=A0A4Y7TGX6_COPMI|nr:hypothetical protein FA13DRAFT_225052 [Coprinellus micaceus]
MLFTLASSGCRARHRVFIISRPRRLSPLPTHYRYLAISRLFDGTVHGVRSLPSVFSTRPTPSRSRTPLSSRSLLFRGPGRRQLATSSGLRGGSAHGVGLSPSVLSTRVAPDGAAEETLVPPHQGNRAGTHRFHPHHLEHLFLHRYLPAGLHARPQS